MRESPEVIQLRTQLERQHEVLRQHDIASLRAETEEILARERAKNAVDPAVAAAAQLDERIARDLADADYVESLRREAWMRTPAYGTVGPETRLPVGWPEGASAEKAVREAMRDSEKLLAKAEASDAEKERKPVTSLHRMLGGENGAV